MKKILICSLFTMILVATGGCISKEDLYGNWYSPQGYGDSRVIITENYWFTFGAPDKYFRKNIVIKSRYDVKDYGVFLRVTHSGFIDTVYNFFGFIVRDRTRYWLGFIPILGFQFSYKISDEEMLLFLQKYKFTRKQAMDELIILTDETSVPDQSIPPLINRLEE